MKVFIFARALTFDTNEYELIIAETIYIAIERLRDLLRERETLQSFDEWRVAGSIKCQDGNHISI